MSFMIRDVFAESRSGIEGRNKELKLNILKINNVLKERGPEPGLVH